MMAASVRRALAAAKVALGKGQSGDVRHAEDARKAAATEATGGTTPRRPWRPWAVTHRGGDSPDASEHSSNAILDAPVAAAVAVALDDAMYAMAYHHRSCGWTSGDGSWWPNPRGTPAAVTASHCRCGARRLDGE